MPSYENSQFQRNIGLLGEEGQDKLVKARVLVCGIGGVGGFVCEALARAGVGTLLFADGDVVDVTNINRQIIADHDTVGSPKSLIMAMRLQAINPKAHFVGYEKQLTESNLDDFLDEAGPLDVVVDAIDDVPAKVALIAACHRRGIPVISAMGCANKTDPTKFQVADLYDTSVDPLAKILRKELKKLGIDRLRVVYSTETPRKTGYLSSLSFVPSVCGLILAGEVIKKLSGLSDWEETK